MYRKDIPSVLKVVAKSSSLEGKDKAGLPRRVQRYVFPRKITHSKSVGDYVQQLDGKKKLQYIRE